MLLNIAEICSQIDSEGKSMVRTKSFDEDMNIVRLMIPEVENSPTVDVGLKYFKDLLGRSVEISQTETYTTIQLI